MRSKTLFRDENLGCKYAVSSAIDWFFENEEEGIILENDSLPSDFFLFFCDAMLEKYRFDTRIRHIRGTNLQMGQKSGNDSYYFQIKPTFGAGHPEEEPGLIMMSNNEI